MGSGVDGLEYIPRPNGKAGFVPPFSRLLPQCCPYSYSNPARKLSLTLPTPRLNPRPPDLPHSLCTGVPQGTPQSLTATPRFLTARAKLLLKISSMPNLLLAPGSLRVHGYTNTIQTSLPVHSRRSTSNARHGGHAGNAERWSLAHFFQRALTVDL